MVKFIIPVTVTGTRITVGTPVTEPTDESRNVFAVAFQTDEAWSGLTLTAIFEADKSSAGYLMASDSLQSASFCLSDCAARTEMGMC